MIETINKLVRPSRQMLHEIGRDLAEKHGGEYKGAKTKGEVRVDTREGEG